MAQMIRFVDRPGGTVLLDLSPASPTVPGMTGASLDAPPPPVNRSVAQNPVRDGGTISAQQFGMRTVKLGIRYANGVVGQAGVQASRRAAITALLRVLQLERVWLEVRPDQLGSTAAEARYLHCYRSADLQNYVASLFGMGDRWVESDLEIPAAPFAYGPKESLGNFTTTVAGNLKTTVAGSGIKGDVPSPMIVTVTGPADTTARTLWMASRPGGGVHKAIFDLTAGGGGIVPSGTAVATTTSSTSVGGSYRQWSGVQPGQAFRLGGGTVIDTVAGGASAKLAGAYRILLLGNEGANDQPGEIWNARLQLLTALTTWLPVAVNVGKLGVIAQRPSFGIDTVIDLGVIEVPFARPAQVAFDAPGSVAPTELAVLLTCVAVGGNYGFDALVVLPADAECLALQYASPVADARTFTVDPYSGSVMVRSGGVVASDAPKTQYQGAPPNVIPGVDVDVYAFTHFGGAGTRTEYTAATLPAAFSAEYWPRYLTVS